MKFVTEPAIAVKIQKMQQRVRWQDPAIAERGIDQTRLVLEDGHAEDPEFSFLVIGDSGSGAHRDSNPQRQIAKQMQVYSQDCRFVLHTGDVVYLVGSSEQYHRNFIEPYRSFLVGGDRPKQICYDRMVFSLPLLPVPGNHDYYDLPVLWGAVSQLTLPLRRLVVPGLDLDIGWHGSWQGNAYAKAFLDYLHAIPKPALAEHLDRHYTAQTETGRCIRYQPGQFTRLPNRYYTFRYGGIDFFAIDSNTFNAPAPLPNTSEGRAYRRSLEKRSAEVDEERLEIMERISRLSPTTPDMTPEQSDQLDDLRTKLQQLEEIKIDMEKQLAANETTAIDLDQLEWLQQRLIESWHTDSVRGRVIYFHHPPYVTEATKWYQGQTLAVRDRLREVLDGAAAQIGARAAGRPLVDLILNGHAHCLEYLRTMDTGYADSHLNWIVCGGSGYSLRRQREEGAELQEARGEARLVAKSQLFVGRSGQGSRKRRPYSFLRIDVQAGDPPQLVIRPFVSEQVQHQWSDRALDPFVL